MDVDTTARAFGCSRQRAEAACAGINAALVAADCTTVRRCAMFAAQVGHETLSLIYDQEIWSPTKTQLTYEGRASLGNTVPGDGYRFRGRGRIQLTGRTNYGAFSRWCHARGLVPTPDYFVRSPDAVATAPWRELAAAWYWTVARPDINSLSDRGDVDTVTRRINGGTNGLQDRRNRYAAALKLGAALLPDTAATAVSTPGRDAFDMATPEDLRRIIREEVPTLVWHHPIPDWFTDDPNDSMGAFAALGWATAHAAHARTDVGALRTEVATLRAALAGATAGSGQPITGDQVAALLEDAVRKLGPLYLTGRPAA